MKISRKVKIWYLMAVMLIWGILTGRCLPQWLDVDSWWVMYGCMGIVAINFIFILPEVVFRKDKTIFTKNESLEKQNAELKKEIAVGNSKLTEKSKEIDAIFIRNQELQQRLDGIREETNDLELYVGYLETEFNKGHYYYVFANVANLRNTINEIKKLLKTGAENKQQTKVRK